MIKQVSYIQYLQEGERGPALRLSKYVAGETYLCGDDGEEYYDVVFYNGYYWRCLVTCTNVTPAAGNYWVKWTNYKLVATDVALIGSLSQGWYIDGGVIKHTSGSIQLNADGSINAGNGQFVVTKDGEVTSKLGTFTNMDAQSGKIAGFKISGNGLTNDPYENDAYVIFRNDDSNTFAGIGGNVLPATSGAKAVARFENKDTNDGWSLGANYAVLIAAQGTRNNRAMQIDGGDISGFAMKNTIISATTTLGRYDYNVICINTSVINIQLPVMQPYDDGHVIRIKRLGSAAVRIYLSYCYTWNGSTTRYSRPCLIHDGNDTLVGSSYLEIETAGDSMELVWVRDLTRTVNGTTYYGAWLQYILPIAW